MNLMTTLKKELKKHPALYDRLRYQKADLFYKRPNALKLHDCVTKVKKIISNIELFPKHTKKKSPGTSLIEITNICNLNCIMCNTQLSKRPGGFIEPAVFEKILQELASVDVKSVGLHTVGETFVYKDLDVLIEIARKNNFHVWLSTNAQFPKRIEDLHQKFPNYVKTFRFSIDGATQKTFEYIRKGGTFKKLIESLEVIYKINNGKKDSNIALSIDSILSMTNIYEIPEYFKVYGKYCWPEKINFDLVNGLSLDTTYFKKEFNFPGLIRPAPPCSMPYQNIYFTYTGKATVCCRDYDEELVIGDITKNTIQEIWDSPEAEKIREMHTHTEKMNNRACENCFGPYNFVNDTLNQYIHYLRLGSPQLSSKEFGDKLLTLLSNMNTVLLKKDIEGYKAEVRRAFSIAAV